MRPDLLPERYRAELAQLLDDVPSFPADQAIRAVEAELGRPIAELFSTFDINPVGAASFAQVHRARLHSGLLAAVKVQRPGLERLVRADLAIIRGLGRMLDASGILQRLALRPLVDDFARWTLDELDFLNEATYAERMRSSSMHLPGEYVPAVFWDLTTGRVLTMEFLHGTWMSDLMTIVIAQSQAGQHCGEAAGHNLRQVAHNLFFSTLGQAFDCPIFHADPHAGNLVVLQDDRIGYVDFGIAGQLDASFRETQLRLLEALGEEDFDGYFDAVLRFFYPLPDVIDLAALRTEIVEGARKWSNAFYNPKAPIKDRGTARLLTLTLESARRFGLAFSLTAFRYYRMVFAVEAIILVLDPSFDYRSALRSFLLRHRRNALVRGAAPDRQLQGSVRLGLWLQQLPDHLRRLSDRMEHDSQTIGATVSRLQIFVASCCTFLSGIAAVTAVGCVLLRLIAPLVDVGGRPPSWVIFAAGAGFLMLGLLGRRVRLSAMRRAGRA